MVPCTTLSLSLRPGLATLNRRDTSPGHRPPRQHSGFAQRFAPPGYVGYEEGGYLNRPASRNSVAISFTPRSRRTASAFVELIVPGEPDCSP